MRSIEWARIIRGVVGCAKSSRHALGFSCGIIRPPPPPPPGVGTSFYSSMVVETPRLPGIGEDGEEEESSSGSGSGRGDDSSSGEDGSSSEDDDGANGAKEVEAGGRCGAGVDL